MGVEFDDDWQSVRTHEPAPAQDEPDFTPVAWLGLLEDVGRSFGEALVELQAPWYSRKPIASPISDLRDIVFNVSQGAAPATIVAIGLWDKPVGGSLIVPIAKLDSLKVASGTDAVRVSGLVYRVE